MSRPRTETSLLFISVKTLNRPWTVTRFPLSRTNARRVSMTLLSAFPPTPASSRFWEEAKGVSRESKLASKTVRSAPQSRSMVMFCHTPEGENTAASITGRSAPSWKRCQRPSTRINPRSIPARDVLHEGFVPRMLLARQPARFEGVIRNEHLAFAHGNVFARELSEPSRSVFGEPFAVCAIARRPLNEFRLRGLHGYIPLVMHSENVTLFPLVANGRSGWVRQ